MDRIPGLHAFRHHRRCGKTFRITKSKQHRAVTVFHRGLVSRFNASTWSASLLCLSNSHDAKASQSAFMPAAYDQNCMLSTSLERSVPGHLPSRHRSSALRPSQAVPRHRALSSMSLHPMDLNQTLHTAHVCISLYVQYRAITHIHCLLAGKLPGKACLLRPNTCAETQYLIVASSSTLVKLFELP